jgi:hypothetical protein
MAKKSPKPRPMKSRRNGIKDRKLIEQNIKVIKNIENQLKKD